MCVYSHVVKFIYTIEFESSTENEMSLLRKVLLSNIPRKVSSDPLYTGICLNP